LPSHAETEQSTSAAGGLDSTVLDMSHDLSRKMSARPRACNDHNEITLHLASAWAEVCLKPKMLMLMTVMIFLLILNDTVLLYFKL